MACGIARPARCDASDSQAALPGLVWEHVGFEMAAVCASGEEAPQRRRLVPETMTSLRALSVSTLGQDNS